MTPVGAATWRRRIESPTWTRARSRRTGAGRIGRGLQGEIQAPLVDVALAVEPDRGPEPLGRLRVPSLGEVALPQEIEDRALPRPASHRLRVVRSRLARPPERVERATDAGPVTHHRGIGSQRPLRVDQHL